MQAIRDRREKRAAETWKLHAQQIEQNKQQSPDILAHLRPGVEPVMPESVFELAAGKGIDEEGLFRLMRELKPSLLLAQIFHQIFLANYYESRIGILLSDYMRSAERMSEAALHFVAGCLAWQMIKHPPYASPDEFLRALSAATRDYRQPEQWQNQASSPMSTICGSINSLLNENVPGMTPELFVLCDEHLVLCRHIVEGYALHLDDDVVVGWHPKACELMLGVRAYDGFWSTSAGIREEPVPLQSWLNLRSKIATYQGKPLYGEARTGRMLKLCELLGAKVRRDGLVTVERSRSKGFG